MVTMDPGSKYKVRSPQTLLALSRLAEADDFSIDTRYTSVVVVQLRSWQVMFKILNSFFFPHIFFFSSSLLLLQDACA